MQKEVRKKKTNRMIFLLSVRKRPTGPITSSQRQHKLRTSVQYEVHNEKVVETDNIRNNNGGK